MCRSRRLPEQRRIAAILDKADELRAKRRAALEQLNGLTQSMFLEMFGDPVTNPTRLATRAALVDVVQALVRAMVRTVVRIRRRGCAFLMLRRRYELATSSGRLKLHQREAR